MGHVYGDDKTKDQLPPDLNTTPVNMEKVRAPRPLSHPTTTRAYRTAPAPRLPPASCSCRGDTTPRSCMLGVDVGVQGG